MKRVALAVFAATTLVAPAIAADVAHGERIARRWCASCHVVAPDQQKGSTDTPSFADIARRYDDDRARR